MIFAIKRFETHDGDGIRTTLFFKGCPLRCKWCHNPESFGMQRQIAFFQNLCTDCGICTELCSANNLSDGIHIFDREACTLCGRCIDCCPRNAFLIYGEDRTARDIATELLRDEMFFKGSGGGVTFSGGEPLLQVELCIEIARKLKKHGVNIAIDTCGFAPRKSFERILPYADTFLYDLKAYDEDAHIRCTGKSNKIILENLKFLDDIGSNIEIRIPYVPEYNDDQMEKIAKFLSPFRNIKKIRLLSYHDYADGKYSALDIQNTLPPKLPNNADLEKAGKLIQNITKFVVLY
ncbi:MAG: glycyl-radical enzyme activating protein [Clostridia bacterium]|nr:glycyl-radical enzyme activating protein [Clostridia bacterium]